MTQTPGPTAGPTNQTNPDGHANGLDRFFGWIRSVDLRRDGDDKWLAGVCSGIATRLGVDPIVIRAVLVLLVVLGGVGITVYLIAWAFLPNNREEIIAEKALRDGDVLGIILLVVIGLSLIGGAGLTGDHSGLGWIWWVIVPIGLVVWLVTRNRDGHKNRAASGQPAYGPPPASYVPPSAPYTAPTTYAAPLGTVRPCSPPRPPTRRSRAPFPSTPLPSRRSMPPCPPPRTPPPPEHRLPWPPHPEAATDRRPSRSPRDPVRRRRPVAAAEGSSPPCSSVAWPSRPTARRSRSTTRPTGPAVTRRWHWPQPSASSASAPSCSASSVDGPGSPASSRSCWPWSPGPRQSCRT